MITDDKPLLKSGLVSVDGEEVLYEIYEGITGPDIKRLKLVDRDSEPLIIGKKEWDIRNDRLGEEDALIHFVRKILEGTKRP